MYAAIDSIAEDLKQKLQEDNEQLVFGAEKFISRYNKLKHSLPLLTSALHRFGLVSNKQERWELAAWPTDSSTSHSSSGRRRKDISRGKVKATPRKPLGLLKGQPPAKEQLNS